MLRRFFLLLAALPLAAIGASAQKPAPAPAGATWQFAVSGDSRNCGDVVMPAIAAGARRHNVAFYWHLGDFRKIYDFDEDMQHEPEHRARPMTILEYELAAWPDFIENQLEPFGSLPVFLSIGNHEMVPPRTRDEYIVQFADWLDAAPVRQQRLRDDPRDHMIKTYYHWTKRGVDFINLDNATPDQFDRPQMKWFENVLARDSSDREIRTVVVGMHRALPESISAGHSMNESPAGIESGRRVYADLLQLQNSAHKRVYVLASHSHYLMNGIFNTDYWRNHGGILPGWIVGTAGAVRYALPANSTDARAAETNLYGYLLGAVHPDGAIDFEFQRLSESDVPHPVMERFTPEFVHWCFAENSEAK